MLENEIENYFMFFKLCQRTLQIFIRKYKIILYDPKSSIFKKDSKENNLKMLSPLRYVENRWLSLGSCLKRIIELSNSLILYTRAEPKFTGVSSSTYKNFTEQLENKVFRLKNNLRQDLLKGIS